MSLWQNTKIFIVIAIILLTPLAQTSAQGKKPSTLAELVAYTGADREQILAAGARAEGKVTWYTSLAGSSYKELAQGFEKKYSVKVDVYRAASNELMARITAEAKARQYLVDTIETTLPLLKSLREDGLLAVYTSPHLLKYPAHAKEISSSPGLYYWGVNRESFIGVGFNPNIIPARMVPKNFAGLLNPQLKGKMGMTTSETGVRMMGAMLKFKGEEFVKKLKSQDISLHSVSGRAMADMAISGEVPLSPSIFRDHAMESKLKGAPINWVPMEGVPTNAGATSIIYQAPHPHGAVLMADYILSPEGQKILADLQFGSPSKDFGFKRWYPEAGLNTDKYDKEATQWQKVLLGVGRKG